MPDSKAEQDWRVFPVLLISLVAVASTWTGINNTWTQDDLPIVFANPAVHSLSEPWRFFLGPYWPHPFPPDLYRPLTLLILALEWAVGGGAPIVFRLVSISLYLVTAIAVWRLALRLLPRGAALGAAALFAAHPVHVEAVAVAVNQAEIIVALIVTIIATAWIDRRRAGLPTDGAWLTGVFAAWAVAVLFKEHAIVLPAILIALEFTITRSAGVARIPPHNIRMIGLLTVLIIMVLVLIRDFALDGNTKGSFTAEAFEGQHIGGRALTMLSVVPEWFRLLVWPEHLRADYSPQVINPATAMAAPQWLGLALLTIAIYLVVRAWSKWPTVSFGLLWLGIALAPVHNVLVPTGIAMAERTLFLGSTGFLIAGVGLANCIGQSAGARAVWQRFTAAACAILVILGTSRSSSRHGVWRDPPSLWGQTLIDAPESYRAHMAWAGVMNRAGYKELAELHNRIAITLFPKAWPVYAELANLYRLDGDCNQAIPLYEHVLAIKSDHTGARGSLVACLLFVGRYEEARETAMIGAHGEEYSWLFTSYAQVADSALAVKAPPSSVRLPPPPARRRD